ncbi:MAG: hypothetical protein Q8R37_04715 [Nanoarchaeota archaeon]|nr:hypothetical protein [Nanoarchaeota archaeon]
MSEENVSLSMGGGLGHTFLLRNNGQQDKIVMKCGTLDDKFLQHAEPAYETEVQDNDLIFLQSDGLFSNTARSLDYDYQREKCAAPDDYLECVESMIMDCFAGNHDQSASFLRDKVITKLSRYFLPRADLYYDDVTFVVVKKK